MYKESNRRSFIKGISYRFFASGATIVIVYLFFGRLDLAIAAGLLETLSKVLLFYVHEKIWLKIRWGKKKIEPFNVWFTGLPLSGKTTIADLVYTKLIKLDIPLERLDSKDVRELIPNIGYNKEERNRHMYRIGHLIKTLQNNSISTVASFVSPYNESRKTIKSLTQNTIVVYIKANIETCKARDYKGVYAKAIQGEIPYFTGITDAYENPENPEITIDTEKIQAEDAANIILKYIKKHHLKG